MDNHYHLLLKTLNANLSKSMQWLKTDFILGLMHGADKNKAYQKLVQEYSKEAANPWEDIAHGQIYGSPEFAKDICNRFLSPAKSSKQAQNNSLYKQLPPETILKHAADLLRVDTAVAPNFKRIPAKEKEKRNLLIYLLWETGRLSNHEIGLFFGLGHSAISRYAGEIHKKLSEDRELKQKLQSLKSKIKKSRPDPL